MKWNIIKAYRLLYEYIDDRISLIIDKELLSFHNGINIRTNIYIRMTHHENNTYNVIDDS